MKELVFLLEEPSAKAMIEGILPCIDGLSMPVRFIVFEGKQDLEKQMVRKLRLYKNPEASFIIMRDQDAADCRLVKNNLKQKCDQAGKPGAIVRIACKELESWYLADLAAVEKAYSKNTLSSRQDERKFRNPDSIVNPSRELKALVPEYQKIQGSRMIALYLNIENSRSRSFYHLVKTIRGIAQSSMEK